MARLIQRTLAQVICLILMLGTAVAQDSVRTYDTRAIDAFMNGMDREAAGELQQAITAYELASRFDPFSADIYFALARLYLRTDQIDKGRVALEKVIALDGHHLEALELLGEVAQAQNEHELAQDLFKRILDLDYQNDYAVLQLAKISHAMGDSLQEAEYLIRLWELDTDRVAALQRAETIYLNANDYGRITALYDMLIKRMPTQTDLVGRQIRLFLGMNRFFDAEALMDSLIEVAPYSVDLQSMKTDLVKVMHGEMAAVDYLSAVVKEFPEAWDLKLKLSQLLIDAGESANARRLLNKILEARPEISNAVSMLVWTYLDIDDLDGAREVLESYLPAFPDDFFLHRLLGNILQDMAIGSGDSLKFEEALAVQRTALALRPQDQQTLHMIANTLEQAGRLDEVLGTYRDIIELYPDDDLALNNYAYMLTEGEVSEDTLRFAADLVERALVINPDNAPYLDTAGWIYFKLGHIQLAREFIDRSLSINPDNPEVLMHMGDILEYLGKSNEAYVYYLRAGKLR